MKKALFLFGALATCTLVSCGVKNDNTGTADDYKYTVVAPNGAPAIALANLDNKDDANTYNYISADVISAEFTGKNADFIIAPINAGAKLYKAKKSEYVFGGVVTWGNLYFASYSEFALNDLDGKTVTLFGEDTINSSVARYVLEQNNINCNYEYLASAQNTIAAMGDGYVLTAEPMVTVTSIKSGKTIYTVNVQNELKTLLNQDYAYTQAGLFINPNTIKNHKSIVDDFIVELEESCSKITTDLDNTAKNVSELGILPSEAIAMRAIPNCNVNFKNAESSKTYVENTANIDLSLFGGALPADEFYYKK